MRRVQNRRPNVIPAEAKRLGGDDPARRAELHSQLDRLRDFYVVGDLTKNQYVMKRQAIEEELSRPPPIDPAVRTGICTSRQRRRSASRCSVRGVTVTA